MATYRYSKYIDPYIDMIKHDKVAHCEEQRQMIDNIVIPVLERDDVHVDEKRIEQGLSLQKYFPYQLIEWEVFLFALIVGVFLDNGDIFFNDIRVIVGRGSGKNGFISFLCFYFLSAYHGIDGYNIDLLANAEQQAKTSFNDVYEVVKSNHDKSNARALAANFYATKEEITGIKTNSKLRYNTSSKRGKDSKRTGCIIYDEKHEYLDATNINTLKSGLGKVWHGREITITTDGHIRGAVLDKEKEQNKAILKEYNPLNRTLVFWCKIEDEDEWKDIDALIKAIPSLNDFPSLRSTIQKEIIDMPYNLDYWPEFMAKRCNFPVGNKDVEVATWDDICAADEQKLINLHGKPCVGGVDYSKLNDFAACALLFYVGGKYYLKQHTFVCRSSRDLPGIKAPLEEWERKGDLTFVDDVEIPPELIVEWFAKNGSQYQIKKIAIDGFRVSLLSNAFKKIGFDAYTAKNLKLIRPSNIMQAAPVINSMFVTHNLVWDNVPIMKWYTNNVKKVTKGAGNIWYDKQEPNYRKTDGFMAFVAAATIIDAIPQGMTELPDVGTIIL